MRTMAFMAVIATVVGIQVARADEEVTFDAVPGATASEIEETLTSKIAGELLPLSTLAFGPDQLQFWARKAKDAHANLKPIVGDPNVSYDVVLQPGHFPRKTGV